MMIIRMGAYKLLVRKANREENAKQMYKVDSIFRTKNIGRIRLKLPKKPRTVDMDCP